MSPDPISERIRRGKTVLISLVFLVLLWLPTLDWLFHLDHAPVPNEKRLLAEFPKFTSLAHSREFVSGLEQYFNDHFGFRKRLIRANNHWKRQLFRDAPSNDVVTGRDDWLFFIGDRTLDHYFGVTRFTEDDLEAWRQLLEKRRDWLARRGAKYVFAIAPDKHSVYPEYLPEWFVKSAKPRKLDQFVEYMKTHTTVEVLDLRKPLLEAKPLGINYLSTDTHWNSLGAFIGYQEVIRALGRQISGLQPLPMEAFDLKRDAAAPAGDLGTLMGGTSIKETQQVTMTPRPPLEPLTVQEAPERLPKKWRLKTDPRLTVSSCKEGKAVVFRDSFAGRWQTLLGYHFREVLLIWQYCWDAPFLEREKPTVVIDEMLERFLNKEDPRELMKQDGLN